MNANRYNMTLEEMAELLREVWATLCLEHDATTHKELYERVCHVFDNQPYFDEA